MKTIYTLIFSILTSITCAQDTTLSTVANIAMPKGVRSVGKKDVENISRQRFRTSTKLLADGRSFSYDNLLISMHEMSFDADHEKTLEKLKRDYEGVFTQLNTPIDASRIETINGSRFLIFESHHNDDHTINFVSETREHKNLSGFIKFVSSDRDKAYQFLQDLLSGVKMKGRRR